MENLTLDELLKKYDMTKIFYIEDNQIHTRNEFKDIYDNTPKELFETEDPLIREEFSLKWGLMKEFYTDMKADIPGKELSKTDYKEAFKFMKTLPYKSNGICCNLNPTYNKKFRWINNMIAKLRQYDIKFIKFLEKLSINSDAIYNIRSKITKEDFNYLELNKNIQIDSYIVGSRLLEALYDDSVPLKNSDMDIAITMIGKDVSYETKYQFISYMIDQFTKGNSDYTYELVKGNIDTIHHRFRVKNNISGRVMEVFLSLCHPYYLVKKFHISWIRMYFSLKYHQLYLTPSCYYTLITGISNINSNISKSSNKIEIIYKYASRGFNIFLREQDKKTFDEYVIRKKEYQD